MNIQFCVIKYWKKKCFLWVLHDVTKCIDNTSRYDCQTVRFAHCSGGQRDNPRLMHWSDVFIPATTVRIQTRQLMQHPLYSRRDWQSSKNRTFDASPIPRTTQWCGQTIEPQNRAVKHSSEKTACEWAPNQLCTNGQTRNQPRLMCAFIFDIDNCKPHVVH